MRMLIARSNWRLAALVTLAAAALPACGGNDDNEALIDDAAYEKQAILDVKSHVQGQLDKFAAAATALCDAAPEPDADGWSAASDADAVAAMKEQWKIARRTYENVEGAIAVLFPDLDASTDERYDGFIESSPDDNLFDDVGVTGVHGIERILWADAIPADVVTFESALANYRAAAFPATEVEARDFKTKLCARFVNDAKTMRDGFAPLALDAASAYRGVIGSMSEQVEKVNKAATGEEESRYAEFTLTDMRENVAGGRATYGAFQKWLLAKEGGAAFDAKIVAGLDRIEAKYMALEGDALPPVPESWSSEAPTDEQLATPFGELFELLEAESDAERESSLVYVMLQSADLLGIAKLP